MRFASSSSMPSSSKLNAMHYYANPQKHRIVTKLWKLAKRNAEQKCTDRMDKECAIAWDTVHDYETALRRLEKSEKKRDALAQYCDIEPSADECREYDN